MTSNDTLPENAAIGNDVGVLRKIHLSNKNIVIYRRGMASLTQELLQVSKKCIEFRASGNLGRIALLLDRYFAEKISMRTALKEDILHLLEIFEGVSGASTFRLVWASVETTMCPRFHADHNVLRMLCTYYGPGTLWLPDHAVDREAYLSGKSNPNILLEEGQVQQVGTGDVVILKGALYPGATPILHRSPGIDENGGQRILLSIDAN